MVYGSNMQRRNFLLVAGASLASPFLMRSQSRAALIEDLVAANRILADEGVLDAYGHVSIRHPTNPNRYLMARSRAPALITAADILEFDLDSNPVAPTQARLFTERFIGERGICGGTG